MRRPLCYLVMSPAIPVIWLAGSSRDWFKHLLDGLNVALEAFTEPSSGG